MTADWSIKVDDNGWMELTVGPKPRRTIGFPPEEGRLLATTLLRMSDVAQSVHGTPSEEPS